MRAILQCIILSRYMSSSIKRVYNMEEIQEFTEELKAWCHQQNLEERSIQSFYTILENVKKSNPESFAQYFPDYVRERFTAKVTEVYLLLWRIHEGEWMTYIVACLPIMYFQVKYGWCKVVFDSSGEICDDTWEYDQ